MEKFVRKFEKMTVMTLLFLMMVVVAVSTVELAVILVQQLMKPPVFLLNIEEMSEVFSFFLMVLIGLELVESVKVYLDQNRLTAEVVVLVALVAVGRKIIILDYSKADPPQLMGIAAIILALSASFYLLRLMCNRNTTGCLSGVKDKNR